MLSLLATILMSCVAASIVADVAVAGYRLILSDAFWLSTFVLCLTGLCTTFLAILYLGFDSADDALYLTLLVLGIGAVFSAFLMMRRLGRTESDEHRGRLTRP